MSETLNRIKQFIDYKGLNIRSFEMEVGFSNGAFASQLKNGRTIGVDKLENILNTFPELNANWLLTGKGRMLLGRQTDLLKEPGNVYQASETEKELIQVLKDQLEDLKKDKERLHAMLDKNAGKEETK